MKYCGGCKTDKLIEDFPKSVRRKDGRGSQCKKCAQERNRIWHKENREHHAKIGATYYIKNREKIINKTLQRKYGITLEEYNRFLEEQDFVCAICGEPESRIEKRSEKPYALAVDHCHETGVVRGLLCRSCNYTIGYFGDNLQGAQRLVEYLEKRLCVQ